MTIDWWTLGFQTVNVVILVWLLQRFFWRPVSALIEKRRAGVRQTLDDAEAARAKAAAALADIEQTRAGFAQEREEILAEARQTAEQASAARLVDAAKEAASRKAAAEAAIERERKDAEKAWADRASRLGVEIAARLTARLDGSAVRAAFLDWLLDEVRALPEPARLAVAASSTPLEVMSAAPLEPAEQERCRKLIGEALGGFAELVFKADPTLIAGLELRAPHLIVSNSWRADLGKILADLTHDQP